MVSQKYASREIVLNAIIGASGLRPTLAVLGAGKKLALANKESLVVAGDIVMSRAKKRGVEILPVDSEHCAIFQCLKAGEHKEVKKNTTFREDILRIGELYALLPGEYGFRLTKLIGRGTIPTSMHSKRG